MEKERQGPLITSGALIAFVICLLVNAVLAYLLIQTRQDAGNYYACMAQWQQQAALAQQTRADANEEVQKAMDALINAVYRQDFDKTFRDAVQNYVDLRADQDRERKAHPYPDLPKTVCGEPKVGQ